MLRSLVRVALCLGIVGFACFSVTAHDDPRIILRRGDANSDGDVDTSDAVFIAAYLESGGAEPPCMNQADANDDGVVSSSDAVYVLNWLYNGGSAPPAPGPFATECSEDLDDYISCNESPCSY